MSQQKKPHLTDSEREELVERLTADLEDYVAERSIAARKRKENEPEDTRTIDEIAEELKNHPAFLKEIDWSKPLPPEVEGLMQLKYESEDPTARATSYKEDGNEQFKIKKYKVAIENYTEAIKSRSPDAQLNAILYTNRAASQFYLGNYRSAFNDCIFARKFKADHMKAIVKGAQCCFEMNKFGDCLRWCDAALMVDPKHAAMLELRTKADKNQRIQERDARKQLAKELKEEENERKLLQTIQNRGIQVSTLKVDKDEKKMDPLLLTNLESHNPTGAKVFLDDQQVLHWPVLFIYPEYAETDFISAFSEQDSFYAHLEQMFGPGCPSAQWDEDNKYKPEDIEIFFENKDEEKLYRISPDSSLLDALRHKKYIVCAGTPGFLLMVRGSKFQLEFMKRYRNR